MTRNYFLAAALIASVFLTADARAGENGFESSRVCGQCHEDIYRNWYKSLHALSYKNPIFQTAYQRVYTESRGKAKSACLICHAPTVLVTGDWDVNLSITKEGVTCDFCHTVSAVNLDKEPGHRFTVKPGKVKRASIKGASSPYHETAYSKDFSSSSLCAACHDYKNRAGVHIQSSFTDWSGSSFARAGKQCQHCHMPRIPGKITNVEGKQERQQPPRTTDELLDSLKTEGIPDHSLAHNLHTMKEAVQIKMASIKRTNGKLTVVVEVINARAGHTIPTGTVARTLVVELRLLDRAGRVMETKKRVYRKAVLDADGMEILYDGDAYMYATEVSFDNRLKVDEKRRETFVFLQKLKSAATIEAVSYFNYKPLVTQTTEMRIPIFSMEIPLPDK